MSRQERAVLIVGGGPAGLTAALLLARQGLRPLLVERHPSTAIHPRARGLNIRTMELYRMLGLEGAIRVAGTALKDSRYMLFVETLAGHEIRRVADEELVGSQQQIAALSPSDNCQCAQDELEPILAATATARGAELRFGTQLLSFVQDDEGVTATLLTDGSQQIYEVRTSYLVAADGAGSGVRQALGIEMADRGGTPRGPLGQYVNIYFRADVGHLVEGRQFGLCFVENPDSPGIILAVNNTDRWLFNVPYAPEQGATLSDFGPERCTELIRAAIGLPEVAVEILSVLPWEAAARVADRFQSGRVLLIGDAAHTMPPAGAFGLNTAVQDAQNVCWKLATVLGGVAEPSLLATYEVERRPLAERVVDMAVREMDAPSPDAPVGEDIEEGTDPTVAETMPGQLPLVLGHRYADGALAADDPAAGTDGKPGTRAQHVWLERTGQRLSTIDLFGDHFVLLAGAAGTDWCDAARTVADGLGLPLDAHRIGTGGDLADPDASWCRAYGVSQDGAVLVRPDGVVGWRRAGAAIEPEIEIARAFGALLGA